MGLVLTGIMVHLVWDLSSKLALLSTLGDWMNLHIKSLSCTSLRVAEFCIKAATKIRFLSDPININNSCVCVPVTIPTIAFQQLAYFYYITACSIDSYTLKSAHNKETH